MGTVLDALRTEVDRTIAALQRKSFKTDPIVEPEFASITSVTSSSYKRHGYILERALVEALKTCSDFEVWRDDAFQVPSAVEHIVDGSILSPTSLIGTDYPYSHGQRTLQIDVLVYDKRDGVLRAYEVKRGNGCHDSGKRRSMLKDALSVQVLLKNYGKSKGLSVTYAFSHIIFYYGSISIPKPFSITGAELDGHFGWPVFDAVEEVNTYFKTKLNGILSGVA